MSKWKTLRMQMFSGAIWTESWHRFENACHTDGHNAKINDRLWKPTVTSPSNTMWHESRPQYCKHDLPNQNHTMKINWHICTSAFTLVQIRDGRGITHQVYSVWKPMTINEHLNENPCVWVSQYSLHQLAVSKQSVAQNLELAINDKHWKSTEAMKSKFRFAQV